MTHYKHRSWLGVTCKSALLLAALSSSGAHAAWQAVPAVELRAVTEDNPRLRPGDQPQPSASGSVLDVRANLATYNPRGFVSFIPRIRSNVYSNGRDSDLDGDDLFLSGDGQYSWQIVTVGFYSEYWRKAIQRAELLEVVDPGDDIGLVNPTVDVDSGRLESIDQDQRYVRLNPFLDFQLSERSTLHFEMLKTEASYSVNDIEGRSSFDDRSLALGIDRKVDERNSVSANLIVSKYEAAFNDNTTDTVGVEAEMSRSLSSLWTVNVTAGVERSDFAFLDSDLLPVDNAALSYTLGIRARKRTPVSSLEFRLEHFTTPSSSSFLADRTEFRAYVNHRLSQRLSTRVGVRMHQTQTVGDVSLADERDYRRFEWSLSWAMQRRWFVTGGYHYTSQEFVNEGTGRRSSSEIFAGIGYRGLQRPGAP